MNFPRVTNPRASKLDNLVPAIIQANDAGLTIGAITANFFGKSNAKAKDREAELQEKLASLVREGAIWGPVKHRGAQYYFVALDPFAHHPGTGAPGR